MYVHSLFLWDHVCFTSSGNAQCAIEVKIDFFETSIARLNTSIVPTCFSCEDEDGIPVLQPLFSIDQVGVSLNTNVTVVENQLIVTNFDSFFPPLRDGFHSYIECLGLVTFFVYTRIVSTLSKEIIVVPLCIKIPFLPSVNH